MGKGISIVVPVGPNPKYLEYLDECIASIREQMKSEDQIVIIDDMSNLDEKYDNDTDQIVYHNAWNLGCSASWNLGVAFSDNESCILMGSDDRLLPGCLDACRETIASPDYDPLGYYNLTCITSDDEMIDLHNNAAMVSRSLWKLVGGFPITGALGAPDALLISIMLVHLPQHLRQIKQGTPFYYVRKHPDQDTLRFAAPFNWEVIQVRNKETERWQKPTWTEHVP